MLVKGAPPFQIVHDDDDEGDYVHLKPRRSDNRDASIQIN